MAAVEEHTHVEDVAKNARIVDTIAVLPVRNLIVYPHMAAPLVATGHFEVAFAIYGVSALAAAFFTWRMKLPSLELGEWEEGGLIARIRVGLLHARERRPAMAVLLTVAIMSLFGVSHAALLPIFAEVILGDSSLFAWIVASTGVGAMAGAMSVGYSSKPPTLRVASVYMIGFGIALAAFSQATSVFYALAAQVVIGYCYFALMTSLQTLLQQMVEDSMRGRVMSLFQVAWAGVVPFGGLGMGAVAKAVGTAPTLLGAAVICGSFGAFMALSPAASMRPRA